MVGLNRRLREVGGFIVHMMEENSHAVLKWNGTEAKESDCSDHCCVVAFIPMLFLPLHTIILRLTDKLHARGEREARGRRDNRPQR